jgi:hypothetical protein
MNYVNGFIAIADDCPRKAGTMPADQGTKKTLAAIQYEMLAGHPYEYTQEDVLFITYLRQNGLTPDNEAALRKEFYSKPRPCLRSSPLPKKYGWGLHFDANGKIAIYGAETGEYKRLSNSKELKVMKALRSKRAESS